MNRESNNNRIGFYYYPDSFHYRKTDLDQWLPRLEYLGASWITLVSHPFRAIPEFFIQSLLDHHITPILQLSCPVDLSIKPQDLYPLLASYAQWGIQYFTVFDRPNSQSSWTGSSWSQGSLVERFLDRFLPIAQTAFEVGLIPVFPPLEPGGDFWDTVFLRQAIKGSLRRGYAHLLENLALGAYGWTYGKPLTWGFGGPDRWKSARPYFTPQDCEDQVGFLNFIWLQYQIQSILKRPVPVIVLGAGCRVSDIPDSIEQSERLNWHAEQNLRLANWLLGDEKISMELGCNFPTENILAVNFWLLASEPDAPSSRDAWFSEEDRPLPIVERFVRLGIRKSAPKPDAEPETQEVSQTSPEWIGHYILIPQASMEESNWIEKIALPFALRKHAKVGASLMQAIKARRVTILGNKKWLDDISFEKLYSQGCMIEEVYGDGTYLASKLAEL